MEEDGAWAVETRIQVRASNVAVFCCDEFFKVRVRETFDEIPHCH
jgi:hypothetical protein